MTDEVKVSAYSPLTIHKGKVASLSVDCDDRIWFSAHSQESVRQGAFWDVNENNYGYSKFRVRWAGDEAAGVEEVKGEVFVFRVVSPPQRLALLDNEFKVKKFIKTHSSVLVEVPFYGEGKVYFDISLANAATALEELKEACK